MATPLPPAFKKNARKFADDIKPIVENCEKLHNRTLKRPLGDMKTQNFVYDPDHCLFTQHRENMYYAYAVGGSEMLSEYLYSFAKDMKAKDNSSSWDYFIDDEAGPKNTPFLLNTIPPKILKAVIGGYLTWRMKRDKDFENLYIKYIRPITSPGIYFIQFFDTGETIGGSQVDPSRKGNKGFGFSPAQLQHVSDCLNKYVTFTPTGLAYAKRVDEQFSASNTEVLDYSNLQDRRYVKFGPKMDHVGDIRLWQDTLKKNVLDKANKMPRHKDSACLWSFANVGFGLNCAERSRHHLDNHSSSKLFGLLNAIIKLEYPQFDKQAWQILHLFDPEHNNLAESLVSVLASSYYDFGGTNVKRGGALGQDSKDTVHQANRTRALRTLFNQPYDSGFKYGLRHQKECTENLLKFGKSKQWKVQQKEDKQSLETFKKEVIDLGEDLGLMDELEWLQKMESVIDVLDNQDEENSSE